MLPMLVLCCGTGRAIAQSGAVVLKEGTPVLLTYAENLSSASAEKDEAVRFILVNDIKVDGVTVAKAGATAFGHVVSVKKAAIPGRSGELNLKLDYVQAGGKKVPLSASKEKGGDAGVHCNRPYRLKWPMGFLRTGDDVEIRQGTVLAVYVAENIPVPASE